MGRRCVRNRSGSSKAYVRASIHREEVAFGIAGEQEGSAPRIGNFASTRHTRRPVKGSNASRCAVTLPDGGGTSFPVPEPHVFPGTIGRAAALISAHHSVPML